jgi:hypothetical protein
LMCLITYNGCLEGTAWTLFSIRNLDFSSLFKSFSKP